MPAPAMPISRSAQRQLELLEEDLHGDYGLLLSILPRSLFESRSGNVVLSQDVNSQDGTKESFVYSVLTDEGCIPQLSTKSTQEDSGASCRDLILGTVDDRLAAINQVPPLSWVEACPGWFGSSEWRKHTSSLIEYYMLVWAAEEKRLDYVPGLQLDHIRGTFDLLKGTRHYEQSMVRCENAEYLDIHISYIEDEQDRILRRLSQASHTTHKQPQHPDELSGWSRIEGTRSSPVMTRDVESLDRKGISLSYYATSRDSNEVSIQAPNPTSITEGKRQVKQERRAGRSVTVGNRNHSYDTSTAEGCLRDADVLDSNFRESASKAGRSAELTTQTTPMIEATGEPWVSSPTPTSLLPSTTLAVPALATECAPQNQKLPPASKLTDLNEPINRLPNVISCMAAEPGIVSQNSNLTDSSPSMATRQNLTEGTTPRELPQAVENNQHYLKPISSLKAAKSVEYANDVPSEILREESPEYVDGDHSQRHAQRLEIVDQHLAQLQKVVGYDLLSVLPNLRTTTFARLHSKQEPRGYLPIRMLFGTINQSAPVHLRSHKVWAVFKFHDDHTTPRISFDALDSDDKDILVENLAFKKLTSLLVLEPVFKLIIHGEGTRREYQIKAMVKYYYMLAADARLHGFEEHFMQINDSFVDQIHTICKRIKNPDAKQQPRVRRQFDSDYDSGTPSIPDVMDSKRRSNRNLKRPPGPTIDSETSSFKSSLSPRGPNKLALGFVIQKHSPSHIKNHFLDPDTATCSSDGDSGDELPASIPPNIDSILSKHADAKSMIITHNNWIQEHRNKKSEHSREARRLESLVKRGKESIESVQQSIKTQNWLASNCQDKIEVRQTAVSGFKEKEKYYDNQVDRMDKGFVRLWEETKMQREECEKQKLEVQGEGRDAQ
jgi:hypothetical protein